MTWGAARKSHHEARYHRAHHPRLGLLLGPLAVEAQPPTTIPTIGFLMLSSVAPDAPFFGLFRQALREVGYVEGQNVHLEYRWADRRA
jgi:hypothetical protein